jgi:glyceraldehyde 3-phosphate dehydrogenase
MTKRVAINGFGRIGRLALRVARNFPEMEIVAINDLGDKETMAHLFKYDSVHGRFPGKVEITEKGFRVDGKEVLAYAEKDPGKLPWKNLNIDVVIESTGLFTSMDKLQPHFQAGAKKVILSAPAKSGGEMPTIVYGVNNNHYDKSKHNAISAASCTTNCLAPMAKVLHEKWGIKRGLMVTVHSYTNDQRILDLPHKDLRRARAACLSMIPTTTGAARAVGLVLPDLKGKLDGYAIRVPTPNVSVVDLTAELLKPTTDAEINAAMKEAAEGSLKGTLSYNSEPLVSSDFNDTPFGSNFDSTQTKVLDGDFVKVLSWYDNEFGFTNQMMKLVNIM